MSWDGVRGKNMQNTEIQQEEKEVELTSPCIFPLWKRTGDIFRTLPISHTHLEPHHRQAWSLATLLHHGPALPLRAYCGTEIHTPPATVLKVLTHTVRPCGGSQSGHCTHARTRSKRASLHGTAAAQQLLSSLRHHLQQDTHVDKLCAFR